MIGLAIAVGCTTEGELGEPLAPIVSDEAVTNVPEGTDPTDTGTASGDDAAPGEDSQTPEPDAGVTDDTGSAQDSTVVQDTGTAIKDSAIADTYKPDTNTTDTYKPDTFVPPQDSGVVTGDWPAEYAALEQAILVETNRRRAAGATCPSGVSFPPMGALVMHPQLQAAARKHSKDMATNNYFAHNSQDGRTPFVRMKAEGYKGGTMGENIAAGNSTAAATMDQWMKSDGHCKNIMNKSYTQLGVGYWYNSASTYRHYWTQNFGAGG